MTPQEKAKELVDKFDDLQVYAIQSEMTISSEFARFSRTKYCAKIAVDEIIKAIDFDWMEVQNLDRQHNYWQQVKSEIENL